MSLPTLEIKYFVITRLQHNIMYSNYYSVKTLQELQDETCVEIREAISSITVLHLLHLLNKCWIYNYKLN